MSVLKVGRRVPLVVGVAVVTAAIFTGGYLVTTAASNPVPIDAGAEVHIDRLDCDDSKIMVLHADYPTDAVGLGTPADVLAAYLINYPNAPVAEFVLEQDLSHAQFKHPQATVTISKLDEGWALEQASICENKALEWGS